MIRITLTIKQAKWLVELLRGTEVGTAWGEFFHALAARIEKNL